MDDVNKLRKSLEFVLKWEGGYVNDPSDPGGETKWGISKRAHPSLNIRGLTPEDALKIYRKDYWDNLGCGDIEFPSCVAVLDTGVNCGVQRTRGWMRQAESVDAMLKIRESHYIELSKQPRFAKYLRGWLNRLNDLRKLMEENKAP